MATQPPTRRRTSLFIDEEKVRQAQEILGTHTTTETVDAALRDVIRRKRMKSLASWDLHGMTLDDLERSRRRRSESLT
jgi:Arc/MetJ family transcription regulator